MDRAKREVIVDGLTYIDTITTQLDLPPHVKERATEIYRQTVEEGSIIFGRGVENTAGTCVLLAVRESDSIKEAEDIATTLSDNIHAKSLYATSKDIRKKLDMGFLLANPHKYADQISNELDASENETELVHEYIDELQNHGDTAGHKASTVAACVFYAVSVLDPQNVSHGKYTQHEIADAAGVTEVSIRNHYRDYLDTIKDTDSPTPTSE